MDDKIKQHWARFDAWPVSSHLWLVILAAFLVFSLQIWRAGDHAPSPEALGPIQHAVALYEHGTFGYATSDKAAPEPAMFYAPLQMAFMAGAMSLDQNLALSLRCVAWHSTSNTGPACKTAYRPYFFLQALILALVPFFAWLMAWQLTGKKAVAWGAAALVLLSGRQVYYTTSFSPEVFILPLFAGLLFSLVVALQSRFWLWFVATGVLSGLLALTTPVFSWLIIGLFIVLCYWRASQAQNSRFFWSTAAMLVVPYLLITGPWMARNYFAFDTTALTSGYMASLLAERLAWNAMTGLELAVSFVYWLSGIGPDLAMVAYPAEGWQRLVSTAPNYIGATGKEFYQQTLAAAGSADLHIRYLLDEVLWPDLTKYLATSLAFFWRGLWVAGYWSLIVVPLAIAYSAVAISRRRGDITLPLCTGLAMLAINACVRADLPQAGDILIPLFSVLAAMMIGEWVRHKLEAN